MDIYFLSSAEKFRVQQTFKGRSRFSNEIYEIVFQQKPVKSYLRQFGSMKVATASKSIAF